jgi:hypothetical protein
MIENTIVKNKKAPRPTFGHEAIVVKSHAINTAIAYIDKKAINKEVR